MALFGRRELWKRIILHARPITAILALQQLTEEGLESLGGHGESSEKGGPRAGTERFSYRLRRYGAVQGT